MVAVIVRRDFCTVNYYYCAVKTLERLAVVVKSEESRSLYAQDEYDIIMRLANNENSLVFTLKRAPLR